MRRKSERNKAKGSPEKKVEKPTRKSTRRRAGRKSPSTSPEKEVASQKSETIVLTEETIKEEETESQSCSQDTLEKDIGNVEEEKVSSSETDKKVQVKEEDEKDEKDAGSVWKVARADASPGEIQKLKLCRQRNTSETSSDSRKKDSCSKWQECGEGVAGEVDSADEQLVSCRRMPSVEEPNDPSSSSNPGQESKQEEVSDSKDLLPETTSANLLSDDKPNIDRQGDACQADDKHDNEHGKAAANDNALSPTTAASSNGELERKDSRSQETNENPPKQEERTEEPEIREFRKESSVENEAEQPNATTDDDDDDDEDNKKKISRKSDSSSDEEREKPKVDTTIKTPPRTGRRKHRNKYGDSSNSDTAESEEESPSTVRKVEESDVQEETKSVEEPQDDVKERSTSPQPRTKFTEEEETGNAETEKTKSLENSSNKIEDVLNSVSTQLAQKPAKVNLKRSFAARILTEKNEVAKEEASGPSNDDTTSQNKENHADSDQERCIPRKRRWGTSLSTDSAPAFSISTDSLKVLVPGAKPLPINEVRLSKDDDEDREDSRNQDKRRDSSDSAGDIKMKDENNAQKNGTMKKDKIDNHIGARRKVSIVKETPHMKSPSPPASKPTNILLIKNLVRPFTLNQIKELLSRTGTIVENGFWMDRIKSKCFVEYANEDQAFETRQALHGISWPLSNPKRLLVEYATKEDMEQARETSKDQPVTRKTETVTADPWQQEWGREEKTNAKVTVVREWDLGKEDGQPLLKDKEREKKEHDKKKRQRSRSPGLEAHLPAPARKFKKKEDEPPPAKLLDDLFRKTKATPCIYWLPLTNEQIVVKEEMRRQHMAEHARRLEEMRRAERNRDGRRRRSPRK